MLETVEERKKEAREKDSDKVQYAYAKDSNSDDVLLMANTHSNIEQTHIWYLDSGCSNHMIGKMVHQARLISWEIYKVYRGKRHHIRWNKRYLCFQELWLKSQLTDVLNVPLMISNLISIGKLLVKGYNMKLEKNQMKVYHGDERLILKAPLENNRTFKVEINTVDHKCLASTGEEDKNWIWHHMYGHLNFQKFRYA